MTNDKDSQKRKPTTSFTVGAIAMVFLAIGYQSALFIHKAAVATVLSNRDHPDTVFVFRDDVPDGYDDRGYDHDSEETYVHGPRSLRRSSRHSPEVTRVREKFGERSYESFPFNPNTVSIEDLMRLGFSQKQAQSIDNYRKAGGQFRRKEDFRKSYVVEDSVFRRLEKFIDIPLLDINKADSTAFDALPGIGPYYAAKMVEYRKKLGGYSFAEQLMDIPRFDQERYDHIKDLITVGPAKPYLLWALPEDSLARHPYLDKHSAHGIILFRDNSPRSEWTVESLAKAGIISPDQASKLGRCRIE